MRYNLDTSGKFKIVMNTYRVFGFWETLKEVVLYLLSCQTPNDDFDKKYGVMTSGFTESFEAGITDETARSLAVGYVPAQYMPQAVCRQADPLLPPPHPPSLRNACSATLRSPPVQPETL